MSKHLTDSKCQLFQHRSRAKITPFDTPQNVARELFDGGARNKKFTRRNEKIAVPLFQETQTTITDFLGRISPVTIDRTRANTAYTSYLCREKGEYPIRKAIAP